MLGEDGERRFCGRKLEAKMIHKNDIIDKFENLSRLSLTHTSEIYSSNYDTDEFDEVTEVKSVAEDRYSFSKIPLTESKEIRSIKSSRSSFDRPKINSKLKIVFA